MADVGSERETCVGLVVVSHSAKLAEGVTELAQQMAGPGVRLAAAGGLALPGSPLGTDAELIRQAIESVYSAAGVLVLLDLGSALLSAELAVEQLPEAWRSRIVLSEAPLVEGAVAAAVQARLGSPLEQVAAEARVALVPKHKHLRSEGNPTMPTSLPERVAAMEQARLLVRNRHGLHVRPAARLVQTAGQFKARVQVTNLTTGRGPADARSLIALTTLDVGQGQEILVTADGSGATAALAAIREIVEAAEEEPNPLLCSGQPLTLPVHGEGIQVPPSTRGLQGEPSSATFTGLMVAEGVAIGSVLVGRSVTPGGAMIPADDPSAEWTKLTAALAKTRTDVQRRRDMLRASGDQEGAAVFDAYRIMLEDPLLVDAARHMIAQQSLSAEIAWQKAIDVVVERFRSLGDGYLAERASDVADLGQQVLGHLGKSVVSLPQLDQPAILVVPEIMPSLVSQLDPANLLGLAAAFGGPTAHGAILARSLGVPVVVGLGAAVLDLPDGTLAILDATNAAFLTSPDSVTLARYASPPKAPAVVKSVVAGPVQTYDGRRISLLANVSSLANARAAAAAGAEGVGLLRTEFLFLDRPTSPSEDEQYLAYRAIAEALGGRPVVIRTLDAGGDKPLPYLHLASEANPFLGQRGIRLCLAQPTFFKTQLRAIARVAAEFPVQVMFPMVATLAEWRAAREQLNQVVEELGDGRGPVPRRLETGIMVEVPAAALRIADFAAEVDFFSIGTNDLSQYVFAADRGNLSVAPLADSLQPALLTLISEVVRIAHVAGKRVAVCGEMATDPLNAPLLIGLGVDELSVNPIALPAVAEVIRATAAGDAVNLARAAQNLTSADEVRALLIGRRDEEE
ncbi:MAG TPA: phosphoenolpyruvate--protein phosphotransferase [Chloroflexota bacterium]|nr:phosphoenolpyruvate--protein phosphotransferase [Chloroflexota bacterium]